MRNPFRRINILAICTGNTCRSPMVEALLRQKLGWFGRLRYKVHSAGVEGRNGDPISENSARALAEIGINAKRHKARKLTTSMALAADFIICLSQSHADRLDDCDITARIWVLKVRDPFHQPLAIYCQTRDEIASKLAPLLAIIQGNESLMAEFCEGAGA